MILRKDIIDDNNPLIRQKSVDVTLPLSKEDEDLALSMIEYLKNSQNPEIAEKYNLAPGVGIAAIQLGILKNMFAVYTIDENEKLFEYVLVNPRLISHSVVDSYLSGGEGCLSVPEGHEGFVKRHFKIKMTGYDALTKQQVTLALKGYVAVVFQHEYDHLSGILYYDRIDKVNPLKPLENAVEI